jgi:hypothetical protein
MEVEYYTLDYSDYTEKWSACSDAQYVVSYCDGDSETSENDQAIAAAVTESSDYCANTCNAWAITYWTAGWMDNCHCADPTSDVCYIANCDHVADVCDTYQYRLSSCSDDVADYAAIAAPLECADSSYDTLCNGDYLTAIYELWYAVSPACDPEGDYNDEACTRLTCGTITNEQSTAYDNVWYCNYYEAVTDEALAAKVEADAERYSECGSLPSVDCSESAVTSLLAQAATDCEDDICNAYEAGFEACLADYTTAVTCFFYADDDTQALLSAWLAGEAGCNWGGLTGEWESTGMDSTAVEGPTGAEGGSTAAESMSGATSEYQGSTSDSTGSSSTSSTALQSTGLGDNNAASTVTVGVAVLASVVLLL